MTNQKSTYDDKVVRRGLTWPHLIISDGTIEALKWLALLLMTVDHVNKFLFNGTNDVSFAVGRIALPLFVFSLAYNLARPGILERGAYLRTMRRLAVFGILAMPAFVALGGMQAAWHPLNIMFTLLVLTAMIYLVDHRTVDSYTVAVVVFLAGGAVVEYWWPVLAFGLAVWWYCKRSNAMPIVLAFTALVALWFVNNNLWSLAAVPVIVASILINLRIPRLRWFFYAYYPLHIIRTLFDPHSNEQGRLSLFLIGDYWKVPC